LLARVAPAVFLTALLVPSLCWVWRDRSVWPWDPAWFGEVTVQLYSTLRQAPGTWLPAMIAAFGSKPPAVAWVGQWFVPLHKLTGSTDLGLHLSILVTQFLTLALTWRLGTEALPGRSRWLPAVGCLVMGSAPLFVGMSHQYFAEPVQNLAVVWVFVVALAGHSWTRLQALSQLTAASALAMLAKSSSPLYCLLPAVLALGMTALSRRGRPPFRWTRLARDLVCLGASLGLVWLTYRWYAKNLETMLVHVRESTTGTGALLYGSRGELGGKLTLWLSKLSYNLFLPPIFALVSLAGFAACAAGWVRRRERGVTRFGALAAVSLLHVAGTLLALSLSINEEPRYLLPLLPSLVVLVLWVLARVPARPLAFGFVVLFAAQWATVHAMTLGWAPVPRTFSPWVLPVTLDPSQRDLVERVVEASSRDPALAGRYVLVGVDLPALNANTLNYHAEQMRRLTGRRSYFTGLGYAEDDPRAAWERMIRMNPIYFISLDEEHLPPPESPLAPFNRVNRAILAKVRRDPDFVQEPFAPADGVVVFARKP
jgi:hypothetical protein